jgi:hypothetical protein
MHLVAFSYLDRKVLRHLCSTMLPVSIESLCGVSTWVGGHQRKHQSAEMMGMDIGPPGYALLQMRFSQNTDEG